MRWPKISIVTPSYNQGKFIERTVRSVLLQRYSDLEYIVMDGGSTDDTLDRLASYVEQFSYFVSEPDKGQADAIANGFARSSGEIMAYLNSDDLLAPDALHFVADFFRDNPNVDWIYSHRCTVDDDDRVIRYWILPPHQNYLMRRWDYIPQETCFWRRSLFEKSGNIDPSYRFAMDYDLFVRFMNNGRGRRLNRFLGAFRDHSTSKTKQVLETVGARETLRVRRKFRIRATITDELIGLLLGNWVQYAGRYFAATQHSLPGGFAGIGYDYNDVWGGLLRPKDASLADPDGSG
jgi:glycosyltransferase involved in cell wall biosynthesis